MTNETMGITVEGQMEKYNIQSGLRVGKLSAIEDTLQETFESRMAKGTEGHIADFQPVFNFIYQTKDDAGKIIEVKRTVSKKISFKNMKSNLYKDIQVLCPGEPQSQYQAAQGVAMMMKSLKDACASEKGPKVYLDLELKESGFTKVKGIHSLPPSPKATQTTLETDEIPFG